MASTCPWSRRRSSRIEAASDLGCKLRLKLKLKERAEDALWLARSGQARRAIPNNDPDSPDSPKRVVTICSGIRPYERRDISQTGHVAAARRWLRS
jgi:hypothetical protein